MAIEQKVLDQGEVFFPYFLEPTDTITGMTMLIIRDDGYYLDWSDLAFKNSGWTTKEQSLSEKTEGTWVFSTGWTVPNAAKTYKVLFKDNTGVVYDGPEILVTVGVYYPLFLEGSDLITAVSLLIQRDDGFFLDFNDLTFKNLSWTTKEQALVEKSEGVWVWPTGYIISDPDRTYKAFFKDNAGILYEGPDIKSDVFGGFSLVDIAGQEVDIVNLALSHLGIGREVANLTTDASEEARCARRFYGTARDAALRDFPWSFATKFATLALVEEYPNDEWGYSFRYPSDAIYIRKVLSGIRNDYPESRVKYKIGQDATGLLIFTDYEDAQIEYTFRETNTLKYPQDFVLAFSYCLASLMSKRLTKGDPTKLGDNADRKYHYLLSVAVSRDANEQERDQEPDDSFTRSRN